MSVYVCVCVCVCACVYVCVCVHICELILYDMLTFYEFMYNLKLDPVRPKHMLTSRFYRLLDRSIDRCIER